MHRCLQGPITLQESLGSTEVCKNKFFLHQYSIFHRYTYIYIYIHSLKLFLNISACGSFFPSSNSHFFTHDAPPFFGHSFAITTWNFPGARQWTVDISGQPLPVIWPMLICLCVMDDSTFQPHISMERPDNFLAGSQLGGGFKYCLCSSLFGEMIPF